MRVNKRQCALLAISLVLCGSVYSQDTYKVRSQAEAILLKAALAERMGLDPEDYLNPWLQVISSADKRRITAETAAMAAHRRDEAIIGEFRAKTLAFKTKLNGGFCFLTPFRLIDPPQGFKSYRLSEQLSNVAYLTKEPDVFDGIDASGQIFVASVLRVPLRAVSDSQYQAINSAVGSNGVLQGPPPLLESCVQVLGATKGRGPTPIDRGTYPTLTLRYLSAELVDRAGRVVFKYPQEWMRYAELE